MKTKHGDAGKKLRVGLLVASDSRADGKNRELCIPAISGFLRKNSCSVVKTAVCPDEIPKLRKIISAWSKGGELDVILTSGGTGVSPRDVTPEATRPLLERELPGIPEAMRAASLRITVDAVISRGVAGLIGATLVVNLPGSPRGAVENLSVVLPAFAHVVAKAGGGDSECATRPRRK